MPIFPRALPLALATGFALLAAPAARADEVDMPALLKRLAAHAAAADRNDEAVDKTCTERAEKLDGDGKVTSWLELVTRVTHPGGREVSELKKATKNGQDVTAEYKPKFEKKQREAGKDGDMAMRSPFTPSEQGKYRFTIKGAAPNDPSKLLIHFTPAGKPSTELLIGHALVDPAKGEALKFTFRPSEYPSMVSSASVEMDVTTTPFGPIVSRLAYQGEGGILFIKQRQRGTTRCYDFAPPPGAAPAAPPAP